MLLRYLAATRRAFHKAAAFALGLVRLATQLAAFDLTAVGTNRRYLGTFGNLTAAWRSFDKATAFALGLVRLATQIATFNLAAIGAKFNTRRESRAGFGSGVIRLLAAIYAQKDNNDSHRRYDH